MKKRKGKLHIIEFQVGVDVLGFPIIHKHFVTR